MELERAKNNCTALNKSTRKNIGRNNNQLRDNCHLVLEVI